MDNLYDIIKCGSMVKRAQNKKRFTPVNFKLRFFELTKKTFCYFNEENVEVSSSQNCYHESSDSNFEFKFPTKFRQMNLLCSTPLFPRKITPVHCAVPQKGEIEIYELNSSSVLKQQFSSEFSERFVENSQFCA